MKPDISIGGRAGALLKEDGSCCMGNFPHGNK